MLLNKGKVECVLKLSVAGCGNTAGKRDLAKRERAALSSSLVCTRRESDRLHGVESGVFSVGRSTSRSDCESGCRDAVNGGVVACQLKRVDSSGKVLRARSWNGADDRLWKSWWVFRALWRYLQGELHARCDIAAHT
jgi:hypothetical protein